LKGRPPAPGKMKGVWPIPGDLRRTVPEKGKPGSFMEDRSDRRHVGGAKNLGMMGILVRTGKYREDLAGRSSVIPDLILESISELREHL